MNIDEAIELLQNQGYSVKKRRKIQIDGSFLGFEMQTVRLDSANETSKPRLDSIEQLRLDAETARSEMMQTLDPNCQSRGERYTGKSVEALRDIARANRDSYCDRLEGYIA